MFTFLVSRSLRNRLLVLRLLCTHPALSRSDIAALTGLTRMTTTNIVSELLAAGLVVEEKAAPERSAGVGRKSGSLELSPSSPVICGVFIGRRHCVVLLGDLKNNILQSESTSYGEALTGESLIELILKSFYKIAANVSRPILGVGISAVGCGIRR